MVSLEQLKKENRRLKAIAESRKDFANIEAEKRRLMQENKALKNPGTDRFKQNFKRALKIGGRRFARFMDNATVLVASPQTRVRRPKTTKKAKRKKRGKK